MKASGSFLWTSLGKKLLTGITGIALMGFIVTHLAGNLTLLGGADAFNTYAHSLHRLGWLLYIAELGLLGLFLLHTVSAVTVYLDKRRARSTPNSMEQSKGEPSKLSIASRSMIVTGTILLVFTVLHVWHFRFGPAESEGYVTMLGNEPVRDLYRLVVERFQSLPFVLFYLAVTVLLGFHLRHGFWSAFQSIGALNPRLRAWAYSAGLVFAVAIAVGFFLLPVYLYVAVPDVSGRVIASGVQP